MVYTQKITPESMSEIMKQHGYEDYSPDVCEKLIEYYDNAVGVYMNLVPRTLAPCWQIEKAPPTGYYKTVIPVNGKYLVRYK